MEGKYKNPDTSATMAPRAATMAPKYPNPVAPRPPEGTMLGQYGVKISKSFAHEALHPLIPAYTWSAGDTQNRLYNHVPMLHIYMDYISHIFFQGSAAVLRTSVITGSHNNEMKLHVLFAFFVRVCTCNSAAIRDYYQGLLLQKLVFSYSSDNTQPQHF